MPSILLVEDDAVLRETLDEFLSESHTCYAARSVEEATLRLEVETFQAILTDISMPGRSGLELLCHVKQRWPETAVIMFSGIHDKEYVEGLIKMGAFDFLEKPFMLEDVGRTVERAIKHYQQSGEDSSSPDAEDSTSADADEQAAHHAAVFSSMQLGDIFTLPELLDIVQRGKMNGYIELHWDNPTIKLAQQIGRFNDTAGRLDGAVLNCAGWIYLKDGLIIDAAIDETEGSPHWRDPELALTLLVKLATYIGKGVRAWGFSMNEMTRPAKLSVRDNSGKVFNIITQDEQEDELGAGTEAEDRSSAIEAHAGPLLIDEAGSRSVLEASLSC